MLQVFCIWQLYVSPIAYMIAPHGLCVYIVNLWYDTYCLFNFCQIECQCSVGAKSELHFTACCTGITMHVTNKESWSWSFQTYSGECHKRLNLWHNWFLTEVVPWLLGVSHRGGRVQGCMATAACRRLLASLWAGAHPFILMMSHWIPVSHVGHLHNCICIIAHSTLSKRIFLHCHSFCLHLQVSLIVFIYFCTCIMCFWWDLRRRLRFHSGWIKYLSIWMKASAKWLMITYLDACQSLPTFPWVSTCLLPHH